MRVPPLESLFGATSVAACSALPVCAERRPLGSTDSWTGTCTPQVSPAAVAARLLLAWKDARVAGVSDGELAPAVDAMMDYHLACNYYENRLDGMRRRGGFGPNHDLVVAFAPNRVKAPMARDNNNGRCGLCDPPMPLQRGLTWRDYHIWPNAFPCFPAADQHILITSNHHEPQGYRESLLGDMLDLQASAAGGRQLTLFFNGTAGNSQFHLHWQGTRMIVPVQTALDEGRLVPRTVHKGRDGRVATYDNGTLAGLLVTGKRDFITRAATRIIAAIDQDPVTQGAYNLVMLQPKNGEQRLVIVPRRVDLLKPVLGSLGPRSLGAINMVGVMVVPGSEIPADFNRELGPALRATVVAPRHLRRLADLAIDPPRQPFHAALLSRMALAPA